MQIAKRDEGDVTVLEVDGEIDLYNAPLLTRELAALREAGRLKVVLNLEKAPYIDSSGIGALVTNLSHFRDAGGLFVLASLQKSIQDILSFIQMSEQFLIYKSESEAIAFFQ